MRPGDTNLSTAIPAIETAKVLREAAERFWRAAEMTSDPDKYRTIAMDYHNWALKLEHGLWI